MSEPMILIENIKMRPETLSKLDTPIEELDWSVRAWNFDMRPIKTVADLIQYSPAQLLRVKNLGKRTLLEITHVLAEMGLELEGKAK